MNGLAVAWPWVLAALPLAALPLVRGGMRLSPYPWLDLLPDDPGSRIVDWTIRLLAATAIALLIVALSGLHVRARQVERIGHGAHIVLLLDRSNSMDNSFAGKAPTGGEQSKADAARRLLNDFVDQRPHDRVGVAEYSTSPLFVMPLTENKQAVKAAIDATAAPALAYTHISKGLSLALSYFDEQPSGGSRIILLVSDGAAVIDPDSEAALRALFVKQQVRLYWLFLRTDNSPGLFEAPTDSRDDNAQAMPERYLHLFFSGLGIPYRAYEAENPDAMRKAIADIDAAEHMPLHYREAVPKRDLSGVCYGWAMLAVAMLLGLKLCEVDSA